MSFFGHSMTFMSESGSYAATQSLMDTRTSTSQHIPIAQFTPRRAV
jgi:hypothetical protein